MIELSVIIVNWNTKNLLKKCLKSICKTTQNISFEIIVIDNGSSDGSAEMVKTKFPQVKFIANHKNRGFAVANNQGIRKARGKFILLLNSDTIILDNAVEKCLTFLKKNKDAGSVGCKLLNADYSLQPSCHNFYSFFKHTILPRILPKVLIPLGLQQHLETLITSWDYNEIRVVDYVCGAFLMIRKEVFQKIGLLDESFFMYAEEADLCLRMRRAGWRVYFFPDAYIIHLGSASVKEDGSEILQRIVAVLLFYKKHHSLCAYFIYRISLLVVTIFEYIFFTLIWQKSPEANLLEYKLRGIGKMRYCNDK